MKGEGHISVSHAEEYCETLFWVFQEITDRQIDKNKIYKSLKRQFLCIENSVRNDIPVRKEIAFFSYKVSMRDSLESVYLAAKEDSGCDAYIWDAGTSVTTLFGMAGEPVSILNNQILEELAERDCVKTMLAVGKKLRM